MCCLDPEIMTRKSSLGLVKVRKSSIGWKRSKGEQRAVRFSVNKEVAFRHVTRDELEKTWYQKRDFDSFKQDCRETAQVYRTAQGDVARLDHSKVCLRGLEQQLTRTSILTRRMTIVSSIKMVLHEQLAQKHIGKQNPDRMGAVSKVMSDAATRRAITVAAFDAKLCRL